MFDFFSFFARMGSITVSNLNVVVAIVVAVVDVVVVVVENEFPVKKKKSPFFSSIENSFRLTFFRTKVEVQTDLSQLLKILWSWRTILYLDRSCLRR